MGYGVSGLGFLGSEYANTVIESGQLVSDLLEIVQSLVVVVALGLGEGLPGLVGQGYLGL